MDVTEGVAEHRTVGSTCSHGGLRLDDELGGAGVADPASTARPESGEWTRRARLHRWRWVLFVAVVGLLGALSPQPVAAVGPIPIGAEVTPIAGGTPLGRAHPVLTFGGQFPNPTQASVSNPLPTVCLQAAHCQLWSLAVATDRPFLVAVHNSDRHFNPDIGLNLYLYDPAGNTVGSSGGVGGDGAAVEALSPSPGTYTVAVTVTYGYSDPIQYVGEARLLEPPSWNPPVASPCTLPSGQPAQCILPQLEVLPPSDITVTGLPPVASTPLGFPLPVAVSVPTSCYLDETLGLDSLTVLPPTVPQQLSHPTLRCLRFTTDVRDIGGGPLAVRWNFVSDGQPPEYGYLPGQCHADQIVRLAGGGEFPHPAGDCLFHLAHGHFHYSELVSFALYSVAPDGNPDKVVVAASKKSFCLSADDYFGFGTPGPANGPRLYFGQPGCNLPAITEGPLYGATGIAQGAPQQDTATASHGGVYGLMGISPGWGDVYTWDTPGQYVDITSVPDGTYDIVMIPNPDHRLLTAGNDRCGITEVTLTGTTVKVLRSWETVCEESPNGLVMAASTGGAPPPSNSASGEVGTSRLTALPNTGVPRPAFPSSVLMLAGLAGLAASGRRRRRGRPTE